MGFFLCELVFITVMYCSSPQVYEQGADRTGNCRNCPVAAPPRQPSLSHW